MGTEDLKTVQNIQEFKKRRTRQWIATVPFLFLLIGLLWAQDHADKLPRGNAAYGIFAVFLLAVGGIMIFTFKNWRCPSCEGYLGKAMNPKFCPKCGAQLG